MRPTIVVSCVGLLLCIAIRDAAAQPTAAMQQAPMEKVTGLGGFFFRSADPKALAAWYEKHLGVSQVPQTYEREPWRQEAGWTVFAPFAAETDYFRDRTKQFMINFRVRSLDAMVAQLRKAGIDVDVDAQSYPNGRFARLKDPEGNPIQLWEPKDPGGSRPPD